MSICDKDCLHCPYPDCINDEMDYDDHLASTRLERDIIKPVPEKQCKKAAYQRAYYQASKGKHADQERIETMRRAAGYTQKQFGALLGVTGSTISLWERGIVRADWDKRRHMRDFGSITSLEAMRDNGIMRLASRISDLKRKGYAITTQTETGKNRYGEKTSYARYSLAEEDSDGTDA